MKVKSEREVAPSCLTLSDPMDCSLPGSSVHGIFQARVLEWGAIAFSVKTLKKILFTVMREFTNVHISPLVTKEPVRNQIRNIGVYIYMHSLTIY